MVARRDLERFAQTRLSKKTDNILAIARVRQFARLDIGRELRKGLPEVVLAEGKDARDVAEIVAAGVKRTRRAIVSRADRSYLTRIRGKRIAQTRVNFYEKAGMVIVKRLSYKIKKTGGRVGLLTAGTSDIPVAEEARIIADEMGCETRAYYDVGVAGLQRLFEPL